MSLLKIPKWKKLEITLSRLEQHPNPKPSLEQYPTPAGLAIKILRAAYVKGDIQGKTVFDLGCGSGVFSIGAALLGADYVVGVDVDREALEVAKLNAEKTGVEKRVDWILADVRWFNLASRGDTVIQNPPFGVQRRGADRVFLDKALEIGHVAYTIHKAETDEFIRSYVENRGGRIEEVYLAEIVIPHIFSFHRKPRRRVKIHVYRVIALDGR